MRGLLAAVIGATVVLATTVALAAGPSGEITGLVGTAAFGSTVSFTYTTAGLHGRQATYTEITVGCSQGGFEVWRETQFAVDNSFVLGGTFWSQWIVNGGGPADCTATLFYFDPHAAPVTLDSLSFAASG